MAKRPAADGSNRREDRWRAVMTTGYRWRDPFDRERVASALLTAVVVVSIGYALIAGLQVSLPVRPSDVIRLFAVAPPKPPPPERPPPPHPRAAAREGASAPPNRKSRATPVVQPPPVIPPMRPPPIVAAPIPAVGAEASSGAAPVAGPGTGAGGIGNGTGSGRGGNGGGAGGTPARQISRDLRLGDLPAAEVQTVIVNDVRLSVYMRFTVGVGGRVTDCAVTRSSGSPALDAATCQATIARLRYRPELDAAGRPVPVTIVGVQEWTDQRGMAPPGEETDER